MWIPLSRTLRSCLLLWIITTVLVVLVVLAQTLTGKLGQAAPTVWLWTALLLLPGLGLLLSGSVLNRHAGKLTPPAPNLLLKALTALYMLLILLTLFFMLQNDHGLIAYFQESYWWLAPLKILLLMAFWLAFWRKEQVFQPDQRVILELAGARMKAAQAGGDQLRSVIFEAIAAGDMKKAFETTKQSRPADDRSHADLSMLQGEYTELTRNRDLNLIAPAEAQRQLNRITVALINLIQ